LEKDLKSEKDSSAKYQIKSISEIAELKAKVNESNHLIIEQEHKLSQAQE